MVMDIKSENISTLLKNINIKLMHHITVYIWQKRSTYLVCSFSPLFSVKFVNQNWARNKKFGEFRPYIKNIKKLKVMGVISFMN